MSSLTQEPARWEQEATRNATTSTSCAGWASGSRNSSQVPWPLGRNTDTTSWARQSRCSKSCNLTSSTLKCSGSGWRRRGRSHRLSQPDAGRAIQPYTRMNCTILQRTCQHQSRTARIGQRSCWVGLVGRKAELRAPLDSPLNAAERSHNKPRGRGGARNAILVKATYVQELLEKAGP